MQDSRAHNDVRRRQAHMDGNQYYSDYFLAAPGPGAHVGYTEDLYTPLGSWSTSNGHFSQEFENQVRGLLAPRKGCGRRTDAAALPTIGHFIDETMPGPADGSTKGTTMDTRSTLPAWMFKARENDRQTYFPLCAPHTDPFRVEQHTRRLAKDKFTPGSVPLKRNVALPRAAFVSTDMSALQHRAPFSSVK